MDTTALTNFFGWMTVINFAILITATIALMGFRPAIAKIHSKMTGLDDQELGRAYFAYLANYKIMALVTSLAPYLALKLA